MSDKKYKAKGEAIKDKYHLDTATPQLVMAKAANKLASIVSYWQ